MSTLNDTDLFIVERSGDQYQVRSDEMSTLNDTDLLLVEREGVQYKLEAQDLDLAPPEPPEVPVATGSISYDDVNANRFTEEQFTITAGAQEAAKTVTTSIKPYVVGLLDETGIDMHGLRFDSDRKTGLSRTFATDSTGAFTYSFWFKITKENGYGSFLYNGDGATDQFGFYLNGSTTISAITNNTPYSSNTTLTPNVWEHIVIQRQANNNIRISKNGGEWDTSLGAFTFPIKSSLTTYISRNLPATSNNELDGYMSDVYFVEEALDPSDFAHTVDGIWSPLPSDTVKQNIADSVQAPVAPNYAENWSAGWSGDFQTNYAGTKGFDGNVVNAQNSTAMPASSQDGGAGLVTWTGSIDTSAGNVILHYWNQSVSPDDNYIEINNNKLTLSNVQAPSTDLLTLDISEQAGDEITSIKIYRFYGNDNATGIAGIEVDGRILIDGPADNSQVWSDGSIVGSVSATNNWANAFDGNTEDTYVSPNEAGGSTLTFASPIPFTTLEIKAGGGDVEINGNSFTPSGDGLANAVFEDVSSVAGSSQFSSIKVVDNSATVLTAIRVDGKLLIDAVPEWNTSQVWSDLTSSQESFFESSPATNAFDGDDTTFAQTLNNPGNGISIDLSSAGLSGDVEVYCTAKAGVYINGDASTGIISDQGAVNGLVTHTWSNPGAVTSIFINDATSPSPNVYSVKVGGILLVDKGNFGANGFFLPFDPAATGENWSNGFTANSDFYPPGAQPYAGGKDAWFNGKTDQYGAVAVFSTSPVQWDGDITGTIEIGYYKEQEATFTYTLDGVETPITETTSWSDTNTLTITGNLTQLYLLAEQGGGSHGAGVSYIKLNGKILVDHNNIGVDASGQGNNFNDSGFITAPPAGTEYGFKAVAYQGNGGSASIQTGISPDLVWIKNRDVSSDHFLFDSVRGDGSELYPNRNYAEGTPGTPKLTFDSNGFTVSDALYTNPQNYIAWCWDAGDTTVENTDGSITSQVRANPAAGFSIVTWTGSGSTATIGHGLGAEPHLVIVKNRTGTADNWSVYTKTTGAGNQIFLNLTDAASAGSVFPSAPTSTLMTIGGGYVGSTIQSVAYCWSEVPGVSSFGSYTGNGSTTGPVIKTGFKPAFLITKRTDSSASGDWNVVDTTRGSTNPIGPYLQANTNAAEGNAPIYNILDDGFQIVESGAGTNAFGGTYIYIAFADPNQPAPDTVFDTPVSDYAVLDSLANSAGTLSNGNLELESGTADTRCNSTISVSSGKWYYEIKLDTLGTNSSAGIGQNQITNAWPGKDALSYAFELDNARTANNGALTSYGSALGVGDVFMCAFDLDNNKIFFGKNGTWFNSSDPVAGTSAAFTLSAGSYSPIGRPYGGGSFSFNFGQQPFRYDPPEGYTGLFVESGGSVAASARLYCVLDADLNITDLQQADPGYTLVSSPATVTFPATLPTGETPDAELPEGTSFGADILVSNNEGSDTATLAQVTPT